MNFAILKRELKGNLIFILVFVVIGVTGGNNFEKLFENLSDSFYNLDISQTLSIFPFMAFLMHLSQTYLREHEDGTITILLNSPKSRAVIFLSKFISSLIISLIIYLFIFTIKSILGIWGSSELFFSNPIIRENFRNFFLYNFYLFVLYLLFTGSIVALLYQVTCTSKLGIALSVAYPIGSVIYEQIYVQIATGQGNLPLVGKIMRYVFYQFFFTTEFLSKNYLDVGINFFIPHILGPALSLLFLLIGGTLFSRKDIKI